MKIKRSYARHVNEEYLDGGKRFENFDFFCEIEEEFEIPGTLKRDEFIQEKSAYLDALCRAEVGKSIGIRTKELEVNLSEPDGLPF